MYFYIASARFTSCWLNLKFLENCVARHQTSLFLFWAFLLQHSCIERAIFYSISAALNEPASKRDFTREHALLMSPSGRERNSACRETSSFVHRRIWNYHGESHKYLPSVDRFIIINYLSCVHNKERQPFSENSSMNEWPGWSAILAGI